MFTICMSMDKSLIVTKSLIFYEKETNVDVIRFLIPPQYAEGKEVFNIADYIVVCKIKTASGKVYTEKLECEPTEYKNRLDYRMNVTIDFTETAGTNILYLTFLKAIEQEDGTTQEAVFHSGSVSINIQQKEEFIFIPDKSLQAFDQMMLAMDEKMNQIKNLNASKADGLKLDTDTNEIYLTSEGEVIGNKVSVNDLGDALVDATEDDGLVKVII